MGLRVSEIANLKIEHIDSARIRALISGAKGKKDRYVNLPASILADFRDYYKPYKPKDFLFEGQYGGPYSIRSVQPVFKNARKKAKVNKKVGVHSLRHSRFKATALFPVAERKNIFFVHHYSFFPRGGSYIERSLK